MTKRCLLCSLCLFIALLFNNLSAQIHHLTDHDRLALGIELYQKNLFVAADKEFESLLSNSELEPGIKRAELEAYRVMCAIELKRDNFEGVVNAFEAKYPYSSELEAIYLKYATVYFDSQNYLKSFEILKRLETRNLSDRFFVEYTFKVAYCNLRMGNLDKALSLFAEIVYRPANIYTSPSLYYSAYIHYMRKDFKKSIDIFKNIVKDTRFSSLALYYILESNFMLKNYDYVIKNGEDVYNLVDREYKSKTARMLSESYFALKKTDEAKFYFEKFSIYSNELTRKDIYYSGIIAYTLKNYLVAIESLQKLTFIKDSLAQNAQYHIANSFIQLKNKQQALNAFKDASESNFDLALKEDAMFNYGKLTFDLNSDISIFDLYLKQYTPSVEKFNEVKKYIANSFILKQDYKSAIDVLNQIKNPAESHILSLQKASFLRGMQLVELGAYRESIPFFELSIKNGSYNSQIESLSQYWLAEAYFRNSQFQESVEINLSLVNKNNNFKHSSEYYTLLFNLGYGYIRLGNYEQAQLWFEKYIYASREDLAYTSEARSRLGDCFFMQKRYLEAANAFSLVSSKDPQNYIYANYQKAIAFGLLGEDLKKIDALKSLIREYPKSKNYPELLYELGRTIVQTGDNSLAVTYFTEIVNNYKETHFYTKSLLELGMISINKHDVNKAIEYYKKVVEESPLSAEAQNALAGLENIYQDTERVEEYLTYLDNLGLSKMKTPGEKELMIFNSAEKLFLSGNHSSAINSLNNFVKNYPDGAKTSQAYFYLGESYYKIGKPEAAIDAFFKVMDKGESSVTELATLNYAQISYQLENYKQALKAYSSLSFIAKLDNNKIEAQIGKMNSFFMDKQFENALAEAKRINTQALTDNYKLRVKYVIAKSNYLLGDRSTALPQLKELAKNTVSVEGAECSYLLISNSFDNGDFNQVEKLVYAFSDSKSPHSYWLAKSFILLGDTYAEKEEWQQAKATYTSILDSYRSKKGDDILEQIKVRLSKIKTK